MGAESNLAAFRRMWDAYAAGRLRSMLQEVAPTAEFWPVGAEQPVVGHDEIMAWSEQVNRRFKSVTVVFGELIPEGDACALVTGHVVMYDPAGHRAVDTDVAWVCEFDDDARVQRMTAFAAQEDARRFASERSATSSPG